MYRVYKHTVPNGKVYIGQTGLYDINRRWNAGHGYVKNKEFFNDIVAYGWKNIEHEILEKVKTKEEAQELEKYYILKYESNNPKKGYNKNCNKTAKKEKDLIQCVETGETYKSLRLAGAAVGRSHEAVRLALKNGSSCAGYHWVYVSSNLQN